MWQGTLAQKTLLSFCIHCRSQLLFTENAIQNYINSMESSCRLTLRYAGPGVLKCDPQNRGAALYQSPNIIFHKLLNHPRPPPSLKSPVSGSGVHHSSRIDSSSLARAAGAPPGVADVPIRFSALNPGLPAPARRR